MIDMVVAEDAQFASGLVGGLFSGITVGAMPDERPAVRWCSADGGFRWMSGTAMPQADDDGNFAGVLGCCGT